MGIHKPFIGTLIYEFNEFINEMQCYKNEMSLQAELKKKYYGYKLILYGQVRRNRTPFRVRFRILNKSDVDTAIMWFTIIIQFCESAIGKDLNTESESESD